MPPISPELVELPDDGASLKAVIRSLLLERNQGQRRADDLQVELLRLQLELEGYKKWYYGPRADRLQSDSDLAQMLPHFAEELDRKPGSPARELCVLGWKPVNADDLPRDAKPEEELRRVKRRQGRRDLANFEHLPVTWRLQRHGGGQRDHARRMPSRRGRCRPRPSQTRTCGFPASSSSWKRFAPNDVLMNDSGRRQRIAFE